MSSIKITDIGDTFVTGGRENSAVKLIMSNVCVAQVEISVTDRDVKELILVVNIGGGHN